MGDICIKATISGTVQGVNFRASTRDQAMPRGITGYAKNLADGRVEVKACGDDGAVNDLVRWLHKGPDAANVTDVKVTELPFQPPKGFNIK